MSRPESNPELMPAARRLAESAGLEGHILRPLDRGLSSDLFTVHPGPDAPPLAVVKLQRGFAGKVYAEAGALEFLASQGVEGAPRLALAEPSCDPPGLVISWVGEADSRGATLDASASFAESFGRWLATLHELEVPECHVKMSSDPLALPDRLLAQAERALQRFERDSGERERKLYELLAKSLAWLEARAPSVLAQAPPRRMIHRDLRPSNVLVDADQAFCGVVDFEHAAAAHPAWDFAKLRWWWFDRRPQLEAPFRAGYESKRAWPDSEVGRLFRIFEATTLVAYFFERHPVYPDQAIAQLRAEFAGEKRPRWGDAP